MRATNRRTRKQTGPGGKLSDLRKRARQEGVPGVKERSREGLLYTLWVMSRCREYGLPTCYAIDHSLDLAGCLQEAGVYATPERPWLEGPS